MGGNEKTKGPRERTPRRTVRVDLRVTPSTKAWLKAHAAEEGLSLTEYVMARTVRGEALSGLSSLAVIEDVYDELCAQGRNLNQLATALNRMALATEGGASGHDVAEFAAGIRAQASEVLPTQYAALKRCADVLSACGDRR